MQRRFCLTLLATGAAIALPGCGFALRKAPNFAFKTLFSPLAETSPLGIELKRSLEANGNVQVITVQVSRGTTKELAPGSSPNERPR